MASLLVKGGAIAGGGALGSYGMYELTDKLLLKKQYFFLFQKENFGTNDSYTSGTFGHAFGRFMLDSNKNESFWKNKEKEVKAREDTSLSTEFQVIKKTNSDYKSLPKVCEDVYKKQKSDVDGETNTNENKYKLSENTWKYCSNFKYRPGAITMQSDTYNEYNSKWGKESNNGNFLLRKDDEINIWDHLFEVVLRKDQLNDEKNKTLDEKFKNVKSGNDLSLVCDEAYKSTPKDNADLYGNNAKEYCVFDKGGTISKYPTKPS